MPNPYAAELAQGLALQHAGKFAYGEEVYGRLVVTASNLVEKIDRLSRKTQYVYDDLHRRIEENWLDGGDATIRTFAHTYDALGRLTALDETIDSSPGTNYAYAYDGLGRLTTETQSLIGLAIDITYESTFDANGRRTKLLSELGAYNDFDNRYYYDNLGRLTSVDQRQRTSGTTTVIAPKRFDFAYNAASQLSQVTRYADLSGFEFVANQFNEYDSVGRLTRLLHTTDSTAPGSGWGSGALAGYDYAYDAATRLTEIDSFVDGLTEYTHDNTSQLTAADHTGQTDENYAYDENGNRTGGGYVTGDNNQTTEDGVYTYTYDAEGNRLTRTRVSDSYVTAYEWDHRNRLVSVTERDDMENVLAVTEHDYDAFNQWIRRTVDADGPGSGDPVETIFAHHDGQIVYQFDGDSAADLTNRYLWIHSSIDSLLAAENVSSLSSAGDVLYPLTDHLRSVRDIAEYDSSTDTTSIANHIRYTSFGAVISETNSAIDLIFGYSSRPIDESTGLQNNLHRWNDIALQQWLSEDPIRFLGGDSNLRRYGANSPIRYIDPDGLDILDTIAGPGSVLGGLHYYNPFAQAFEDTARATYGDEYLTSASGGELILVTVGGVSAGVVAGVATGGTVYGAYGAAATTLGGAIGTGALAGAAGGMAGAATQYLAMQGLGNVGAAVGGHAAPTFSAEELWNQTRFGGLFGGVLGGAFGAAGRILGPTLSRFGSDIFRRLPPAVQGRLSCTWQFLNRPIHFPSGVSNRPPLLPNRGTSPLSNQVAIENSLETSFQRVCGRYVDSAGEALDGIYKVVVMPDGSVRYAPSWAGTHAEIAGGSQVQSAGQITFSNGQVAGANITSGHYQPLVGQGYDTVLDDVLRQHGYNGPSVLDAHD